MRLFLGLIASASVVSPILSQPVSVPAPDLKTGDSWVFDRAIQRGTSGYAAQRFILKVQHASADGMVIGIKPEGSPVDFEDHAIGSDWSQRRIIDGVQTTTGRPLSFPLAVGKTWTSSYTDPTRHCLQASAEHHETYKVAGWEDVTTPAGVFHTLKIEAEDKIKAQFVAASGAIGGAVTTADGSTIIAHTDRSGPRTVYGEEFSTFYYAPEIKYWVKSVEETYNGENIRTELRTNTLVSFKPG